MELFVIDSLTKDGLSIPINDSSVKLENALGYENEPVPSAAGEHGNLRKRVVPKVTGSVQFGAAMTTDDLKDCAVQIVLRQSNPCGDPKRVRLSKCNTASIGTIGEGAVEVSWNVLGEVQWL